MGQGARGRYGIAVGELIGGEMPEALYRRLHHARELVAVVATAGDNGPDTAPVSLVHLASPSRLLLGLARDRRTLANILSGSRLAVSVTLVPDVAVTVGGAARVVRDPMSASANVVAVEMAVDTVKDDRHPDAEITAGLSYRWTDPAREAMDLALLRELRSLSGR
jgi:hypothetical protein